MVNEPTVTMGGPPPGWAMDAVEGPWVVVLAYDPGETTGWACYRTSVSLLRTEGTRRALARSTWALGQVRASPEAWRVGQWVSDNVDRMLAAGRWCYEEMMQDEDTWAFVYEGFRLRERSSEESLLAPVKVASVWKDRLRDVKLPVFEQLSSGPLYTVSDRRLQEWCMYRKDSGIHARDAQRHAIHFLRRLASEERLREELGL